MSTDYRLVKVAPFTDEEMAGLDWGDQKALKTPLWRPPASARIVPPPPDYSTPTAVTTRCYEASTWSSRRPWIELGRPATTFVKALKAFRAVVPELPCKVEDSHISRWRIVQSSDKSLSPTPGGWALVPMPPPLTEAQQALLTAPKVKRARKARSAVPA